VTLLPISDAAGTLTGSIAFVDGTIASSVERLNKERE